MFEGNHDKQVHPLTHAKNAKALTDLTPEQLAAASGGDPQDFADMATPDPKAMAEIRQLRKDTHAGHVNAAGMSVSEDGEEIGAAALLKSATGLWEKFFGRKK